MWQFWSTSDNMVSYWWPITFINSIEITGHTKVKLNVIPLKARMLKTNKQEVDEDLSVCVLNLQIK